MQIVERLRKEAAEFGPKAITIYPTIMKEAADEIERLLSVCKDKTILLRDAYAQNERLRTALREIASEHIIQEMSPALFASKILNEQLTI